MDENTTWIKLYRGSKNHCLFKKPLIWHLWTLCLIKAYAFDKIEDFNGQPFTVKRGQFITSIRKLSTNSGLSMQNTRTALRTLENHSMIEKSTQQLNGDATLITICNYDKFQSQKDDEKSLTNTAPTHNQHSSNTQSTQLQHTNNTGLTTIKKDKKDKKDKNKRNKIIYSKDFEFWWTTYPKRNGKRLGKKAAFIEYQKISKDELLLLAKATKICADSPQYPKDAVRFLKDDFWKDYLDGVNLSNIKPQPEINTILKTAISQPTEELMLDYIKQTKDELLYKAIDITSPVALFNLREQQFSPVYTRYKALHEKTA
jgi:hypothetical protein